MRKKVAPLIAFFSILITLSSCSEYQKLTRKKSDATPDEKKEAAYRYYDKEDYLKAVTLFEDVMSYYTLTSEGEKMYFTYSMANYKMGDYYLAGYYFKRFIRKYPSSKHAEEAMFLSALCSVKNSPEFSLDQTETYNALDQLQIFVDQYPNSNRIDSCNTIMDDLRAKLEKKQFEYAQMYYRTEGYKSAVVALEETLEKYPESVYKEEIYYLLVMSNYKLAINSVINKKTERLNNTLKSYRTFVAAFPESSKLRELESVKKDTENALAAMKEETVGN